MSSTFDPHDRNSWFFGPMTRQEAIELLQRETDPGVFLVRNSNTIQGDLVLCVREETRVSHYIIHKISQGAQTRFKIGEQMFPDMPNLLQFYKNHFLDTAPLVRPASKQVERVRARFDFNGSGDTDDLPFRKGEILTIISKDEDQWWTARNSLGQTGQIPVNYIEKLEDSNNSSILQSMGGSAGGGNGGGGAGGVANNGGVVHLPPPTTNPPAPPQAQCNTNGSQPPTNGTSSQIRYTTPQLGPTATGNNGALNGTLGQRNSQERKLPAKARVKQARVPNAYDKTALRLDVGDIILVTAMHKNGQWEGELRGKTGHFPFTHVEFLDSGDEDDEP